MVRLVKQSDQVILQQILEEHMSTPEAQKKLQNADPFLTYVYETDQIQGCLFVTRDALNLRDKKVGYGLFQVYVKADASMDVAYQLIHEATEDCSYHDLIVLSTNTYPQALQQNQFIPLYIRHNYHLKRADIPVYSNKGLDTVYRTEELRRVYEAYIRHFSGYRYRDETYFQHIQDNSQNIRERVIVYRDTSDTITGYMIYDMSVYPLVIKELIYLDSASLLKLLNYALNMKDQIQFSFSESIQLDRILPHVTYQKEEYLWGKITDIELFNRLYNVDVKTSEEAFSLNDKPLFIQIEDK